MSMVVINGLKLFHLLAVMLAVGGAISQLIMLSKYRASAAEAEASERAALAIFRALAFPGVMTAFVLGLALAAVMGKFSEPWVHAKLTLVLIWIVLAHVQLRGGKRIAELRASNDVATLEKTKAGQINMSRGVAVLILLVVYLAVFQLDAF